jgi:hypothetical protein
VARGTDTDFAGHMQAGTGGTQLKDGRRTTRITGIHCHSDYEPSQVHAGGTWNFKFKFQVRVTGRDSSLEAAEGDSTERELRLH